MVNKSTGFTPFQLRMGWSPHMIPSLIPLPWNASKEDISTHDIICWLHDDVLEAQDNLLHTKISQSIETNKHQSTFCLPLVHVFILQHCTNTMNTNQRAKNELWNSCLAMMVLTPSLIPTKSTPLSQLNFPMCQIFSQPFRHQKYSPSLKLIPQFFPHTNSKNLHPSSPWKEMRNFLLTKY